MSDFYEKVYDQETKERFLSSIDLNKYPPRWWERVFEKSYILEALYHKDLYAFTAPEIIEFYKFLDVGTINPLIVYNTNILKYAQWALNEHLIFDGQNHYDELDVDMLSLCLNNRKVTQSILSYDEFIRMIYKVSNEQDKYLFFCLFEGIKGKDYDEIINLKMSDINEQELTAHLCSGRDIKVSQEFINVCRDADRQTEYASLTGNKTIKLIPSITIFKEKARSNGQHLAHTVYRNVIRNLKLMDMHYGIVTAKSIRDSGFIYHLNMRAKEKGITAEELLYDFDACQDLVEKYCFNYVTKKGWVLQYKSFLY